MLDERRALEAMVAEVVDAFELELDQVVTGVLDRVMLQIQGTSVEPSPLVHEALRRGVVAVVRDALARLRSKTEPPLELPPDLLEVARAYASSGQRLAAFADPWLAGQEEFWDRFQVVVERTLGDAAPCWEVVKMARLRLRGLVERLSRLFYEACEREAARVAGINDDSRLRVVLRALDGQWVDPDELGYDLAGHHVAAIADAAGLLDAAAHRTNRDLLRVRAPGGETWGWLGGPGRIADDEFEVMIASVGSAGARIAFGEPAEGIVGFATSHRQALEAWAIAVATNEPAVRFADLRVLVAMLRDSDLARGFIEHELGELDRSNERMVELRETLRTYLEHSQSVSATAVLRRRDRKTIERQLRSAEQLIRHPVSDRSDEVLIALRVAEILRSRD